MKRISLLVTGALIWTAAAALAQPKLVRRTMPAYPTEAKEAGIAGKAIVEGIIAPDGRVHNVRIVSGPPVLADAAAAAVRKWEYTPANIDGQAVAARTRVTMTFELPGQINVQDDVSGANSLYPVNMVRPAYPPEAKAAGLSGTVRMRAVVGKDGSVLKTVVTSGEGLLAQAAVEAVKQWKYDPTVVDGQPVDVLVDIDVNFTLSR